MERPRMRPLFKLSLPVPAARLMAEIGERVRAPRARFTATMLKRHVELTVHEDARHFWSPHLNLDVFDDASGQSSTLRGRYAPHPSIWTFLMAVYGVLAMVALGGTVYGWSQWNLGGTPWALGALPVAALGALLTWAAGAVGQKLAADQMEEMHIFLEDCVRRASDPPPDGSRASG